MISIQAYNDNNGGPKESLFKSALSCRQNSITQNQGPQYLEHNVQQLWQHFVSQTA